MAQVSRNPISKAVYERCWEIFTKTLINLKHPIDAQRLITDLLTPTERIVIIKRLGIALLLHQEYDYQQIKDILKVSSPTIASVSNALKSGNDGYRKSINKIIKDENFYEILNQTLQKMITLPARGGMGSGAYRYVKKELRKNSLDKKPF